MRNGRSRLQIQLRRHHAVPHTAIMGMRIEGEPQHWRPLMRLLARAQHMPIGMLFNCRGGLSALASSSR